MIEHAGNLQPSHPEAWRRKVETLVAAGPDGLHVVSDWDRTLTGAADGVGDPSTYALLVHGNFLGPEYNRQSRALFNTYRRIETAPRIPAPEKARQMQLWWSKQYDLLVAHRFSRAAIDALVETGALRLRRGAWSFLRTLNRHRIPLLILSAGIQNVIEAALAARGARTGNIHVIANTLVFDAGGVAVGYHRPLIHSLNKTEAQARRFDRPGGIARRKNVLLLGDTLEDIRMAEGLPHDCLLSIAFPGDTRHLDCYSAVYDAVIPPGGSFRAVNALLKRCCGA